MPRPAAMNSLRAMTKPRARAAAQGGSFLLEALISVLIVAFGILGLIGLQARAIQNVDDAQYRSEAAYVADALLGQMWVYDRTKLIADFDSGGGGPVYAEFKAWVGQRLPGAITYPPIVTVTQPGVPTATSTTVYMRIRWKAPSDPVADPPHFYEVDAILGSNT